MFFLFLIIQIIINVFHSARIQNICEINRTKRIDSVDDIEKVVETNKKDIESIKKDINILKKDIEDINGSIESAFRHIDYLIEKDRE